METSEEFRVSISGPTMSFFLFEAVNRPTDFEGLLFGDYQRCSHREISDQHDADNRNRPATVVHDVVIRRIVPTGVKFSFYDRKYNANLPDYVTNVVNDIAPRGESFANGTGDSTSQSGFLGWFRFQKCPPHQINSEMAICRSLTSLEALRHFPKIARAQSTFNGVHNFNSSSHFPWPGNGPFYLFSYPASKNNILEWGVQLKAFNQANGQLRPVRMQIHNLGDTTHADYWKLANGGCAASVDRLLPGVASNNFAKMIVDETDRNLVQQAKHQLMTASQEVINEMAKVTHRLHDDSAVQFMVRSADHFAKYGYSPSSRQELLLMLKTFQGGIGSGSGLLAPTLDTLLSNSPDVFGSPRLQDDCSMLGDTCPSDVGQDWTMVDKIDQLDQIVQELQDNREMSGFGENQALDSASASAGDSLRQKRPKENVSSSSSGATTSDELSETVAHPANSLVNGVQISAMEVDYPQTGTRDQVHRGLTSGKSQPKKKSKNSDDAGNLLQDAMLANTDQFSSSQASAPETTPQVSVAAIPKVGKGRGRAVQSTLSTVEPPPGFGPMH